MEETECPACGGFNLTRTGVQKVRVTEFWADGDLFAYEVSDFVSWVGVIHYTCDDCEHKWEATE